jgi:hypothetical protein
MSGKRKELKRRRNREEQLLIGGRDLAPEMCVARKGKEGSCEEDPREHGKATERKWPRLNGRTREKEK